MPRGLALLPFVVLRSQVTGLPPFLFIFSSCSSSESPNQLQQKNVTHDAASMVHEDFFSLFDVSWRLQILKADHTRM
jgi:hypothetical protein